LGPAETGHRAGPWERLLDPHGGLTGTRQTLVLISDFFAPLETLGQALSQLRPGARTLLAVRVIAPSDRDPFGKSGDVNIHDIEVGPSTSSRKVAPDLAAYREKFEAHHRAIQDLLATEGIPLADIDALPLSGGPDLRKTIQALIDARILEPI
jgi:hypothetical protein